MAIHGTIGAVTGSLTVTGSLNLGGALVNHVYDEDTMSTNSATALATQQSIKAYVDANITAQDLDVTSDSGTIAIDLDSETLTIAGTSGEIETSATGNTVTVGLPNDVTVAGKLYSTGRIYATSDLHVSGGDIDVTKSGGNSATVDLIRHDTSITTGEDIGIITTDVKKGDHVHTHNCKTKRW